MAGTIHNITVLHDDSFALEVKSTTYVDTRSIDAATPEAFAVPAGAKYAVFGASGTFFVRYNATLAGTAASSADTTDGSGCEVNPTIRYLSGTIAEISVGVTTNATVVSITFFS